MKIGIDGRLWNETGVGRYIRNLVYNLSDIDNKNEYILFLRSEDLKEFKIQPFDFAQGKNSKFKIVPVDIRWHTLEEQFRLPKILEEENLDLVHFPYFSVPVRYKKPYVITIHDLILNHFPTGKASTLPLPIYKLKYLGYKNVLDNAVKNAKKIIVPLTAVKDDVEKTLNVPKEKVVVTHEGVDLSLRANRMSKVISKKIAVSSLDKLGTPRNDIGLGKYFLYVGNAYPHKNLERLIEAFRMLRKVQGDIDLILVGKDDYFYKRLGEKIRKEKVDGIKIRNNVTDEELLNLYRNALALVAPSLMEGFGLPVLEAMASGCLVIASDIPSFREVARDAVSYFDPFVIEDIKTKLESVLTLKKEQKKKYIDHGLDRVKQFSWKKMAEETLKVYESCFSI